MSTEQGATHKESNTPISLIHAKNTMGRNQYQYYRTFTKIRRQECYSGHNIRIANS